MREQREERKEKGECIRYGKIGHRAREYYSCGHKYTSKENVPSRRVVFMGGKKANKGGKNETMEQKVKE